MRTPIIFISVHLIFWTRWNVPNSRSLAAVMLLQRQLASLVLTLVCIVFVLPFPNFSNILSPAGSDPGITFNLYAGATKYTIPGNYPVLDHGLVFELWQRNRIIGPSVFTCDGSTGPVTTPSIPPSTTTSKPSSTSVSSASPTTTSASGTVAQWGQCGGKGWIFCPMPCVR